MRSERCSAFSTPPQRIVAKINECAARVPPTPTPEVVTALYAVSFSLYDAFTRAGRSNVEVSVHRALHARFAARSSDAAQDLAARSLSCTVAELHAARDEFFKSLAKQVAECAERAVAAGWAEVGVALVDRVSLLASRTVPAVVVPKPALMTAAEAHAAAAAEGLTLLRAENSTGFKNVYHRPVSHHYNNAIKPFKAQVTAGAATSSATSRRRRRRRLPSPLPRAGEFGAAGGGGGSAGGGGGAAADDGGGGTRGGRGGGAGAADDGGGGAAAAAAEGLTLLRGRSDSSTGFKGVSHYNNGFKSFKARLAHGGCMHNLGNFATAEEAALAVARFREVVAVVDGVVVRLESTAAEEEARREARLREEPPAKRPRTLDLGALASAVFGATGPIPAAAEVPAALAAPAC